MRRKTQRICVTNYRLFSFRLSLPIARRSRRTRHHPSCSRINWSFSHGQRKGKKKQCMISRLCPLTKAPTPRRWKRVWIHLPCTFLRLLFCDCFSFFSSSSSSSSSFFFFLPPPPAFPFHSRRPIFLLLLLVDLTLRVLSLAAMRRVWCAVRKKRIMSHKRSQDQMLRSSGLDLWKARLDRSEVFFFASCESYSYARAWFAWSLEVD